MKQLALLSLLTLAASVAQAQSLGFKAGTNAAVLDGEKLAVSSKYRLNYHVGAFYNYKLAGPVSLRPELQYSLQGGEFKSTQEDYETKLQYLNFPLLLDIKLGPLHLQGGPQFGLLLTAKEAGTLLTGYNPMNGQAQYSEVSRQVTEQYKKQDFSLCAGVELDLGNTLAVGGRFNAGMNEVSNFDQVRSANDPRLKNRVIQGYLVFKLGN